MAIIYLVFIYFYNFDREGLGEFDVHIPYVNVRWLSGIFHVVLFTLLAKYVQLGVFGSCRVFRLDTCPEYAQIIYDRRRDGKSHHRQIGSVELPRDSRGEP